MELRKASQGDHWDFFSEGHPGMPFICWDIPFTWQKLKDSTPRELNDMGYHPDGITCHHNERIYDKCHPYNAYMITWSCRHCFARFTAIHFPVTFLATASLCGQILWMPWQKICYHNASNGVHLHRFILQAAMVALPWSQEEAFLLTLPTTYEHLCKGCAWWIASFCNHLPWVVSLPFVATCELNVPLL